MTEIAAIPWNGLTVASLFSGCGGSCLGWRMAPLMMRAIAETIRDKVLNHGRTEA